MMDLHLHLRLSVCLSVSELNFFFILSRSNCSSGGVGKWAPCARLLRHYKFHKQVHRSSVDMATSVKFIFLK